MATTTLTGLFFSETPIISASGRYIAYKTRNVAVGNTLTSDIIRQDLLTGELLGASASSDQVWGNRDSLEPAISADGRFVVYSSDATNLVPGDTNGERDLFLADMVVGTTTRISLTSSGGQIPANTPDVPFFSPSISADGRFVAFQSEAQLDGIPNFPNGDQDIFVRDVVAGTTTIVSVNSSGVQANSFSSDPSISADGRFVAFVSFASNLAPGDSSASLDIFVRDRLANTTIMASVNSQGVQGSGGGLFNSSSSNPVMAPNGRFVVFQSGRTNLVPNDTNGVDDIFLHDLQTRTTTRISVDSNGNQANGGSAIGSKSAVSADGRYIIFQSAANNLVLGDTNNATDVFLRDLVSRTTTRVSVNSRGEEPVDGFIRTESYGGSISADGNRVVFMSNGRNMNDAGINTDRIYVRTFQNMASSPLTGTNGSDRLISGTSDDVLTGLGGNDILNGAAGRDRLIGGIGKDTLTGGVDADQFVFDIGRGFNRSLMGIDVITDFQRPDKIILDRSTFTALRGNRASFQSVGTVAQAKNSRALITYVRSTGALFYNQNGRASGFGQGGQFADFRNGLNLAASDFIVQV